MSVEEYARVSDGQGARAGLSARAEEEPVRVVEVLDELEYIEAHASDLRRLRVMNGRSASDDRLTTFDARLMTSDDRLMSSS